MEFFVVLAALRGRLAGEERSQQLERLPDVVARVGALEEDVRDDLVDLKYVIINQGLNFQGNF